VAIVVYGLLVSSPEGRTTRKGGLEVRPDQRVELAAVLARLGGDLNASWPRRPDVESYFASFADLAAPRRIRAFRSQGLTAEVLAGILLSRGSWPDMDPRSTELDPTIVGRLNGGPTFLAHQSLFTPGFLDSLVNEARDFAVAARFDSIYAAARPALDARGDAILADPTLNHLTARLEDFLGEASTLDPVIVPTILGPWRGPFVWPVEGGKQIIIVDRAENAGKLTPETNLSWICLRELSRPSVEKLGQSNRERIEAMAPYWDYLKQGVAATTTTGWEDCFNAHLYRAIDLRVRPQEDGVERELRISSALQAGLGMIRAIDGAMTGYDRGRNFYRRFTDYYPTLLEQMAGLEARVRVERPRLGLKVTAIRGGLRIDEILHGHSAEGSALKVGDVVVEADSRPTLSEERLAEIVQSHRIGSTLPMVIERDGSRQEIALVLSKGRLEYEFFRPAAVEEEPKTPAEAPKTPPTPSGSGGTPREGSGL
jgi:hypothetical protein